MAKWGQGDPRWIVEERPDATNVNNWHWTEKNASPWSKERFNQLFKNVKISSIDGMTECIVESVNKCSGEATANNRKGRLIYFYDWELTLEWSGRLKSSDKIVHKGKVSIPNLSEEHKLEDVEITITIDESNEESEKLKQFMYNIGRPSIREILGVYVKELKEEYAKNLILPKKNEKDLEMENSKKLRSTDSASLPAQKEDKAPTVGYKLDVCTLIIEENFQCSSYDLYNVLTKSDMVTAFTRAPAKVDASRGGEFHLYGGYVHGIFDELHPESMISFRWRLKSWPCGHYSNVIIELTEMKSYTRLKLTQTGIPAAEYDTIKSNWYRYYWHSIKQTFGFGVPLADIL